MHLEFPFLATFLHTNLVGNKILVVNCFPIIDHDLFLFSIMLEMLWWGWYAWRHVGKRRKKKVGDSQGCFTWDGCLYTMKI
jgi:hypothetical protein